jgi:FMN phosphatase YigB (HAD superfamily)
VRSLSRREHPDVEAVVFDFGGVLLDWNPSASGIQTALFRSARALREELEEAGLGARYLAATEREP